MAETSLPPATATPKRKRDDMIADMRLSLSPTPRHAKSVFSFQPPNPQPIILSNDMTEDGCSSPRSGVVQKFRDLAIEEGGERKGEGQVGGTATGSAPESGGGAAADARTLHWIGNERLAAPAATRFDFDAGTTTTQGDMQLDPDDDDGAIARKRARTLELDTVSPESTINSSLGEISNLPTRTVSVGEEAHSQLSVSIDPSIICTVEASESANFPRPIPSSSRSADSKSRARKRAGTPPLSKRKGNARSQSVKGDKEEEPMIVDPVRAALTWREDEITIYDPEDKDDDGTGINGIGFKPTAAVASYRAQKRRQQLAEYKKREESEARARRNQRRREQLGGGAEMARQHSLVRVHFSDAPPTTVMTT
ncbi:hypothetical protein GGR51DRAFT_223377 [Nemania sp. FL0031]|nr:hypothetical protein GGR51DRAFT_223377 [Nemania sp. FL0031]